MSSPWSVRREARPDTSRLLIERAHEEFVNGNPTDPRMGNVRGLVRDSWRRSVDDHVGVEGLPPVGLTPEALEEYRRHHPLATVIDMIRGLLIPGEPDDCGVVVAVGDAAGRLLWVEGDWGIRSLTGDMGFVPGADWSESAVGTAAPGTALRLDSSVQIHGAEHFNRLVQPWSCTAAPVHDPETRRLIGVIDVTGGEPAVTPQAQLLVDATARAVESELLLTRLRAREMTPIRTRRTQATRATVNVLGRDRAMLHVHGAGSEDVAEISTRHAELLLCLITHRQGLSAERLAEFVYGDRDAALTLRAEMVRLRKVLQHLSPALVPESRPYRLVGEWETDAHQVLSLLERGAHRVALATYTGPVLPSSDAAGVEEFRQHVAATLREALMAEASVDVLLGYADTDAGTDDEELLRLCLSMLPPRSPKRAGLVARIEALAAAAT